MNTATPGPDPTVLTTEALTREIKNLREHFEQRVDALERENGRLRTEVEAQREKLAGSRETNWSMVLTACGLALAMYAAAVRPLELDVHRQETQAADLARAVLVQNDKVGALRDDFVRIETVLATERAVVARESEARRTTALETTAERRGKGREDR